MDIERVTQGQVTCEELVPGWDEVKVHYHKNAEHYLKQQEKILQIVMQLQAENDERIKLCR